MPDGVFENFNAGRDLFYRVYSIIVLLMVNKTKISGIEGSEIYPLM